jgi:peptidoglycan/xylan/chitin deacetylase (PgdA/CDA1 family)
MKSIITIIILLNSFLAVANKKVAITIDDVPNSVLFEKNNFRSLLLEQIDSMNLPVTIFINESKIYATEHYIKNFELLIKWFRHEMVTSANHTFSHKRYSEVGFEAFKVDVIKGESITRALANQFNKELKYFRFPYNDMGADSIEHMRIKQYLKETNYIIAPFTVESSDWMFNYIYEYYLERGELENSKRMGDMYVNYTLDLFDFYDSVMVSTYEHECHQIYLCHDNQINQDYLTILLSKLKAKDYEFVTLDEAMTDPVYEQPDKYYKKWGVSWLYRWLPKAKRRTIMQSEPEGQEVYDLFEKLKNK